MNIKHKLSIFAATLLLAACSSESVIDTPVGPENPDPADDANRREVLLTLKNNLQLKQPRAVRAAGDPIATEEENYIRSLDVYVFGAKEETGPYTFQELHYFRDDASEINLPGVNTYSFNLNNASDNTTTGLLKLNKGLYVKLYCVANRTHLYQTDAAKGTISEVTDFKSLVQTAPGQPANDVTAGVPQETDFVKFHTRLIDPDAVDKTEDDVLVCPLPMTGAYTTPLDLTDFSTSARTQISFKLARMVARFDVVNDSKTSKFTIEKISMGRGQSAAGFFPITTLVTNPDKLISYPERDIAEDTQKDPANYVGDPKQDLYTSTTKGAFYTWPSPQADGGYLILKGKYAVNQTESKQVSYQIPFQQMVNGVGSYIEVAYNHRYTIAITKADEYHLDFNLKVADWDEGEPVDEYEPENSFDRNTPITLDNAASLNAYVLDNGQVELLGTAGSKFAFEMGSNTALEETLIYKDASEEWVVKDPTGRSASMTTKYAYKVDDSKLSNPAKLLPVIIRLTNPASGTRKEIKIVPTPGPTVKMALDGNSKYVTFDELTNTATMYNLDNQSVKLMVMATTRSDRAEVPILTTGSSVTITDNWLASDVPSASIAEGEYTLTMTTAQATLPASTTATFEATASGAQTEVTVKLKNPAMDKLAAKDFVMGNNQMEIAGGAAGVPKATLIGIKSNSFSFTVTSPEGVSAETTGGTDWLEVSASPGADLVNGQKTTVITATIKDATNMGTTAKSDGVITITNPVDGKTATVEVHTSLPAGPTITLISEEDNPSSYDASSSKASLYNAAAQKISFETSDNCTVTTTDGWLTVAESGKSHTHTITINTAQSSTATTGTLTFTNDNQGVTTVTVVLKDPAITALVADDFHMTGGKDITFAVAAGLDNAKVTMADPTEKNAFTLKVKSPNGISVDTNHTSTWLTVTRTAEGDVTGGKESVVTVAIVPGTDLKNAITDGKIVLKNAIAGGGDMTIDVVTTVTPVAPVP